MLDRDNEQSKSCPAQLDMGPQVLGRVPQGISLYLLLSGQSFLLSDLHPLCFSGNHAPFISSKLSPFPTSLAWMSEESQEKVLPPPTSRFCCRDWGGPLGQRSHSTHCSPISKKEGRGKELLSSCSLGLPPSGAAHRFPAQLVCCLGLPLPFLPHLPPRCQPPGHTDPALGTELPRKPGVLGALNGGPRGLTSTLSLARQSPSWGQAASRGPFQVLPVL